MTSTKYTLYFIFNVVMKYLKDVAAFRFTSQSKVQSVIEWSENLLVVGSLVNFFRFLHTGKQASVVDYLLGLDSCSMYGNKRRDIGYSHMTRELVWGGFMVRHTSSVFFCKSPYFCNNFFFILFLC